MSRLIYTDRVLDIALVLRKRGMTWVAIAKKLELASRGSLCSTLQRRRTLQYASLRTEVYQEKPTPAYLTKYLDSQQVVVESDSNTTRLTTRARPATVSAP